jgi:hypothetical protein
MYDWERIALWFIVLVMAVKIFMGPQMSFYSASTPMGVMDLAEFKGLPDELKQFYQDNVLNRLIPATSTKFSATWAATPTAKKEAIKAEQLSWINNTINMIDVSAPVIS